MVQNFRVNTSSDVLEVYDILVGGFNPYEQKCSSDWIISPNSDENYKQNKTTTWYLQPFTISIG